jgi:hypothetical protein
MNKTSRSRTPPQNRSEGPELTRVTTRVFNRPSPLAVCRTASALHDRIEGVKEGVTGGEGNR